MILEQMPIIFHATLYFGDDESWYNWCLVEWVDYDEQCNTYPGKILGFFSIQNLVYVVIQSSSDPITMEQLTDNFIRNFVLEDDQQMVQQSLGCFQESRWSIQFILLCTPKKEVGTLFWTEDSFSGTSR
jgi:hypothetical protein